MNSRTKTSVAGLLIFSCLCLSVLTLRKIEDVRERIILKEALYIPSAKVLKAMSLGYTGLMADLYWTRVVQYFGGKHHQQAEEYKLLAPLLEITTTLDPHLLVAYEYGAIFLAQRPPGRRRRSAGSRCAGQERNPGKSRSLAFVVFLGVHLFRPDA